MEELMNVDESTMINGVGYDPRSETLEVAFNTGRRYRYQGVPLGLFKKLIDSDSKGKFMSSHIIDVYPCLLVPSDEEGWEPC